MGTNFTNINFIWTSLRTLCEKIVEKHVPAKMTYSWHGKPWVNINIKRLKQRGKREHTKKQRDQEILKVWININTKRN